MKIRESRPADRYEIIRMLHELDPVYSLEEHTRDYHTEIIKNNVAVYVLDRGDDKLGGFIWLSEREWAEGCKYSPVGYVEGWYVDEDLRRKGYGQKFMEIAETWARNSKYKELASDVYANNPKSLAGHRKAGFEKTAEIVTFRKVLT